MLKSRVFLTALRNTTLRPLPNLSFAPLSRAGIPPQRPISSARLLSKSPAGRIPLWRPRLNQRIRHDSSKSASETAEEQISKPPQSIRERFKVLSKKYGWAAVGVYFGLSVLDFPFCFLAVRLIGPDRIGEAEHWVVNNFWNLVALVAPSMAPGNKPAEGLVEAEAEVDRPSDVEGHKIKENASM